MGLVHLDLGRLTQAQDLLFGLAKQLADGEQADERGHQVHAADQDIRAEGQAVNALLGIDTDGGDQQAQGGHGHTLKDAFAADAGYDGQAEYRQHEVVGRAEFQGQVGELRGKEQQADAAEQSAHH